MVWETKMRRKGKKKIEFDVVIVDTHSCIYVNIDIQKSESTLNMPRQMYVV